jgi:hypothetical protein
MAAEGRFFQAAVRPWLLVLGFLILALLFPGSPGQAIESLPQADLPPGQPAAACAGGPTIDGVLLDECYDETFLVGGVNKTIRVWYTNIVSSVVRTREDGTTVTLTHYISTDAQAVQVAQWGRQAWERYYAIFNRHPYDTGCGNRINVQMEDGDGWGGIAYWASPASCRIGIDSPLVRGGSGQWVVYHEFQHYLQYSFNSGCYAFLQANYDADAEFVEGYADLASDAVDSSLDALGYGGITYNPASSMYAKGYGNLFNKYFIEQLGSLYAPSDPWHHMDAMRSHYAECDNRDTLYVFDTLIPSLKAGMNEQKLFTNFFAANWGRNWADAASQPELVYLDDDGNPYGNLAPLTQNQTLSPVTPRSYNGESTPDQWAAKYYQVTPQSDCAYVQANVNGSPAADLGINLMAAKTSAPASMQRFYAIGEDFSRTFRGYNAYDRIAAAVNAFNSNYSFDVSFSCVTPALNILEPRQANFALVGDPTSPISFLARFTVKDGANPVLGIPETAITAFAGSDPITIVPNSLQQVGEEYWLVLLPPVKAPGTTFVDLSICLDTTLCDTETNALLYANPGSNDLALVFDGSGSMAIVDTPGEGSRLQNAQKAGRVMADLLHTGDRVLVTSFSAFDSPPGCGMPGGSGDCALDIQTLLGMTEITGAGDIPAVRTAIDALTAREWTPIGAALRDAKDQLLAPPSSDNPSHIILLSDGEENVNPLYGADAALRSELFDSGVVIDTIGFSSDATPPLLAQIAADTGGVYRFVPTSSGTLAPVSAPQTGWLAQAGAAAEQINLLTTAIQPGPLGLDNVYDYLDTKNQGAARLIQQSFVTVPDSTWQYLNGETGLYVDESVNHLRIVVAAKQADADISGGCPGYFRHVEIFAPWLDPKDRWYPVSPPLPGYTPAEWDVRNSEYDDVVLIPNPKPGIWRVRTAYHYSELCAPAGGQLTPQAPAAISSDFMISASAETALALQGRFLAPLVANQGRAGDIVPIVAALLDKKGAVPGAIVAAAIEKPGGLHITLLLDDGLHSDGSAGDGIYGWNFPHTTVGGSYNVRIVAWLWDDESAQWKTREWLGGFWIDGPSLDDQDKDGMPDRWELRCKLDPRTNDAGLDKDNDGLLNGEEFQNGTSPCNPDTDHGGEKDGSEVDGGRNPLYAPDDKIGRLLWYSFEPINNGIVVRWSQPISSTYMLLSVTQDPLTPPRGFDLQNNGIYTVTNIKNDMPYYLSLAGGNGQYQATGPYSEPEEVIPKADPDAPVGSLLINHGDWYTFDLVATLSLSASDDPLPGIASPSGGSLSGAAARLFNMVSGITEMRISSDPSFTGAAWKPFEESVVWQLPGAGAPVKVVYVQFRDAAGNESIVVYDEIFYIAGIYLPLAAK